MPRISPDSLESFATKLADAMGSPPDVAAQLAESLVRADLAGHHSHGTHRLPRYTEWVDLGVIDPEASAEVRRLGPVTAAVDGNHLFGQVVGRHAVEVGVEKAAEHGLAAVGIRNGAHLGRIGEWAERTTEKGMLFAAFVNSQGQGPLVAPAGSTERKLGTNPIAFGVPTFDALPFPIVLDMATSQVAHGKLSERRANEDPIPEGWVVDDEGGHLTDPVTYEEGVGALRPVGGEISGYKGTGLAVIAELFAGIIGGGTVFGMEPDDPWSNGAAFITVDPTAFGTEDAVVDRVAALAAYLSDAEQTISPGKAAKGDRSKTLLPGEGEYELTRDGTERGIEMSEGILRALADLARAQGLDDEIPAAADV